MRVQTSFVLLLIFMVLCLNLGFSQTSSSCPSRQKSLSDGQQIFNKYKFAVFKVYMQVSDASDKFLGTATLIDKRGYFLTASHIFELSGFKFPGTYPGKLKLKNEAGLELSGTEIAHRAGDQEPDISLIRGTPSNDLLQEIPVVDPAVESPPSGQDVFMMGYPKDGKELYYHHFMPIVSVSSDKMLVVTGGAFHGESGSLAINPKGQAIGILHRRDPNESVKIFFTLSMMGNDFYINNIDATRTVYRLLDQLERGITDDVYWELLSNTGLSNIELIKMVDILYKDREGEKKYIKGLQKKGRLIFYWLHCKELPDHAWKFSIDMASAITKPPIQ